jgi:hypothetical protein
MASVRGREIVHVAAFGLALALAGTAACAGDVMPPAGGAVAPLPADEPVRKGMLTIRDLVRTNHSLVTHRRMPPDHARRFAAQVKIEAERILATSRLSGEAHDKLRALLDEIVAGLGAVGEAKDGDKAMDGLAQADAALARYPQEFDDPTWAPLQSLD